MIVGNPTPDGPACCGHAWATSHSDECYRAGRDVGLLLRAQVEAFAADLERMAPDMGEELPEGEVLAVIAERLQAILESTP